MTQSTQLIRGSTSVSANGSATTTLFTNTSSGNGTRIITNQISVVFSGSYTSINSPGPYGVFILNSGGGASTILGHFGYYTGSNSTSTWTQNTVNQPVWQMYIGSNLAPQVSVPGFGNSGTTEVQTFPSNINYVNTTNGSQMGSVNANGIRFANSYSYNNTNSYAFNYFPQNFWMGPSDTLTFRAYWQGQVGKSTGYQTCTVYYAFAGVTES